LVKYKTFHLTGQKKDSKNACFITPPANDAIVQELLPRLQLAFPDSKIPGDMSDLRTDKIVMMFCFFGCQKRTYRARRKSSSLLESMI
jgi:hypothetical protein